MDNGCFVPMVSREKISAGYKTNSLSATAAETKKQPRQKGKPQKSSRRLKQKLYSTLYSTAIVPTCNQRQPRYILLLFQLAINECLRQCDGPCKTPLDVRHLTFFDICEHVACEQCLENAPRIEACIGGSGLSKF
uniref:Uncharacterized protein n=1 Tax=Panagrolaimus davidi TaxID=227884 RepID=A0A914PBR3_9BILA